MSTITMTQKMLLYGKKAQPKVPKRRSRAGCIHCKEKKKKCNEERPQCDRCAERDLKCEYEAIKPRKRRRSSMPLSQIDHTPDWDNELWPRIQTGMDADDAMQNGENECQWESASAYTYQLSDTYTEYPIEEQTVQNFEECEVEEIVRSSPGTGVAIQGGGLSRSPYMDLATIAPSPIVSPLFEFCAPVYQEFSDQRNRRQLVDHFCNVLSPLIVFKEDTGNPFRQLVLPLSHASSPVMNAIFALSSAHLEYRGVSNSERSLDFHNKALQGLAELIDFNDVSHREEVLGAIMLLVYYEVLVRKGNSNIVHGHLKGALTIMESHPTPMTPTSLFLERAFRFYDVISALSWGTAPISSSPPSLSPFTPVAPIPDPMDLQSPFSSVDTLLGMATDLWPIIHRLSNLLEAKKELSATEADGNTRKAAVLRTELESTCQAIENALKNWNPVLPVITDVSEQCNHEEGNAASDFRMQSILNNAEAYRQAAFVYLYRYIKDCPRKSVKVQRHSRAALEACARVVDWQGPMSALLWPLFIASIEAVDESDRELSRSAFGGTERRQGMTNIARAWELVEEVWRNEDNGIDVCWRGICAQKGFSIVFG